MGSCECLPAASYWLMGVARPASTELTRTVTRASLIPVVRRFFRRPADDEQSSNDTEYAFRRSKSIIRRILDTIRNNSALASVAVLVLSVMYVFQAEVALRVARTVSKRLKRLIARIEIGDEAIVDKDMDMFNGWRWRVLMWKS